MNTTPKISVIVPVYNTEKYLHRCIDSILLQTFTDFELLLIDDGSKDSSGAICDEYASKDNRVRVFHKENGGVSSARNLGLDNAKGEWIAFVDSDDWMERTMYDELYKCAMAASAEVVYCDFNMSYKDKYIACKSAQYSDNKIVFLRNYIAFEWTCLWNILAKKEIYIKNNLHFIENISYCEDFCLSVRLLYYANKVSYVEKSLYSYNRMNETSIMHSLNDKIISGERRGYLETIDFGDSDGWNGTHGRRTRCRWTRCHTGHWPSG